MTGTELPLTIQKTTAGGASSTLAKAGPLCELTSNDAEVIRLTTQIRSSGQIEGYPIIAVNARAEAMKELLKLAANSEVSEDKRSQAKAAAISASRLPHPEIIDAFISNADVRDQDLAKRLVELLFMPGLNTDMCRRLGAVLSSHTNQPEIASEILSGLRALDPNQAPHETMEGLAYALLRFADFNPGRQDDINFLKGVRDQLRERPDCITAALVFDNMLRTKS